MDINIVKQRIESMNDEVDIVQSYSIAIEHLEELLVQINFMDNPIPLRNDINTCVHNYFRHGICDAIEECRNMIKFHLTHAQSRNKDVQIINKKEKLSFQFVVKK